jgi:hypothetical protein
MNSPSDSEAERISDYLRVFNEFMINYHNSSQPEDQGMIKQWQNFKKIIEKSPYDTEAHETYINSKVATTHGNTSGNKKSKKSEV